jgi:hypothetical protein
MLVLGPVDVAGSSPATEGQPTEPPTLTASLSPTALAPNAEMTYSSVDPCPAVEGVRVHFSYWHEGDLGSGQEDMLPVHDDDVEVAEDGSWTTVMPAPADGGQYEIIASCLTDDQDPSDPVPREPPVIHAEYRAIDFEVIPDLSEDPSTNTDGPAPQPARPVPGDPSYTG